MFFFLQDKSLIISNNSGNTEYTEVCIPSKRLEYLEMEAMVQKAKAQQAEKALILSKSKKSMAIENLESEKTLLLASRLIAFIMSTNINFLKATLNKNSIPRSV